jgi:LysM repeat protein
MIGTRVTEEYGYTETQKNNWYMEGRVPSNTMYVPVNFDLNRSRGYDPIPGRQPAAMVNDTIYVVEDATLKAVDLKNFRVKWNYTPTGIYGYFSGVAVRGNLIFILKPYNISVIEDMGSTFRVLWEARSEGGLNDITFDERNIYYSESSGETSTTPAYYKIIARNPLSGQILWEHTPIMYSSKLLTGANRVYISGKRRDGLETIASALNMETGLVLWEKTVSSTGFSFRSVYSDGILYVPIRQNEGSEVYALDANTGNVLWKYIYRFNFKESGFDAISINQEVVLFLDSLDNMIALDKKTGAVKWNVKYGDPSNYFPKYDTRQRPILTDSQIFVDKNNKIKVFSTATGALLKEFLPYQLVPNGKYQFALLMLGGDRMVVQSYDGACYLVSPDALPKVQYVIQAGDTLSKIATRFNTSVQYLVLLNLLDINAILYIGQKIWVPQIVEAGYVQYTVRPGDTLYRIAQANNTTVDAIASLNSITNVNNIYPGQILKIPVQIIHTVMPGESLWLIAAKYNVPMQEIIRRNGITNPNMLYVGQKLIIK